MSVFFIGHPKETHLALFAGGELGPVARWRIEKHLQNCESCQMTVSDFFHLQGDLGELSRLPSSVDWDSLALRIREAVAEGGETRSEPSPGFFSKPLVLRFGLATAAVLCGFIVVQEYPFQESPETLTATKESVETLADALGGARLVEGAEDLERKDGYVAPSTSEANYEIASQEQQKAALSKTAADVAAPQEGMKQSRDARNKRKELAVATEALLSGDNLRPSAPAPPAKKSDFDSLQVASNFRANEGARRRAERGAGSDAKGRAANAPATATAPGRQEAFREDDALRLALVDRIDGPVDAPEPERERSVGDKAEVSADEMPLAELRSAAPVGQQIARRTARSAQEGAGFAMQTQVVRTSIAPPSAEGRQVEIDVKTDGGLRFRTVDVATGRITITDVYAP